MAHFRGVVEGARGEASRLGHESIRVSAQSWEGEVTVSLWKGSDGLDRVSVEVHRHPGLYATEWRKVLVAGEKLVDLKADALGVPREAEED